MLIQDIFEILEMNLDYEREEKILTERAKKMDDIIVKHSNYYIAHFPDRNIENQFKLIRACDYMDLIQEMSIKEGLNLYRIARGFQISAYYGIYTENLYLYPISDDDAKTLQDIIDRSDFSESIVIDSNIAQYCY